MSGLDNGVSALEDKAVELISSLQELGPQLTDVALGTASVMALQSIVYGFVAFVVIMFYVVVLYRTLGWFVLKANEDIEKISEQENARLWFLLIFYVAGFISSLVSLFTIGKLFNVVNWVGIWHPEIYLASKLLG